MKLYIGCGLTQAPENFKTAVGGVKDILRKDFEILDFVGLTAGTNKDVYLWDIHTCVETCDAFIAIVDYPALGLGYELGVAVEKLSKPTLALAHKDALVTRLVLGINKPNYQFIRYDSLDEVPHLIQKFIATL